MGQIFANSFLHFVVTDSPKRWFLLHWLSFCTTVTGVLTLLFARGHYSIDVLLAYWITTRVWWIYHTMANNPEFLRYGLQFLNSSRSFDSIHLKLE